MTALARLSLANRALIALVAVVATAFGVYAIPSLKQQLLPSLEFPAAAVVAPYQGASAEVVEQQVSRPIEEALRGVAGLTTVSSTSQDSMATVQASFDFGTATDDVVGKMQRAVDRIKSQLPDGVEPTVVAGSTDDLPAVTLAATSDGDPQQLADRLDRVLVPALQEIDGVREASITGARTQTVTITVDNAALARAGLSAASVTSALQASGRPLPAGSVTQGTQSLTVQVGDRLTSVDQLRDLYLTPTATGTTAPGGRTGAPAAVRLGDVATIEPTTAAQTSITRTDGKDSLGVSITVTPDGNAVDVSHAVRDKLPDLAAALGEGAKLTVVFDQAPFVEQSIEGLTTEGLLGLVFAVLVILVFLFSVRSTLVTAVSIPLSVVIALIVLWAGDYSLNLLTLGALTIAVGRVVDDSIVVLENIKRHLGYGEDKRHAIITGVREVAGAVTASTLTTVAVFLPIAAVGGMVGELFAPFAITVTVALLASLLVALTVIPVLSYWFLKPPAPGADLAAVRAQAEERELRSPLQRAYIPVLRFVTRRRAVTLVLAAGVLAGTLALVPRLETNFIDQTGQNTLSLSQELPVGTSLATTDEAAKKVEAVLADTDGVQTYQVTVGSGGGMFAGFGGGGGSAAKANYSVTLTDDADAAEVERVLRERTATLTDAGTITIGAGGGGAGFNSDQIQVIVSAADDAELRTAADTVQRAMGEITGLTDVTSDLSVSAPRLGVRVDQQAAARHGLTEATVGQLVSQAFRGATVTQLTTNGVEQDVVLRTGTAPTTPDELRALQLPTAAGPIRLDAVAEVSQVDGPVQIRRTDGERSVTVSGKASAQNIGGLTTELQRKLDGLQLPGSASYKLGGVSANQQDAFADLGLALLVAIAIVFVIMVATFRSLVQPLILLVSIPFAATGAIGLLLLTGTPLGVPALIGMLMLVGIVVTNAIVLIDLVNQYRADGMSVREAVIEGGRRRLRPILMTAAATICALVPMSLGLTGGGGFISQPLAVVVIGGLISSTLLTLLLVPALYTIVENTKERMRRRRQRRHGNVSDVDSEVDRVPELAGAPE
ncbi:efflux RND transporter permease subunit [Goodfellowiella coeruleoviolacea]|uniref:Hydrophobic/amphiphilic exporter-1, HAE1 family n=1 Tax=Goodfellowiella coeruleoviolacea TaxID=334858 RepID=A0AAE3GB55_9PSEU|nr:efflux RND transporter permease subunit [Goodfellowiella coeruleoviolacea]MCP2165016.1 hydrophobic/amphiphilic exporter-1, HAE1 family [Goodfellowiella coeruleoviolacea]